MTEQLNELELTNLMINTNHITAVLGHLQGVIRDLQTIQTREYSHRLTAGGELASLEVVDDEFGDMTISRVDAELEDFGEMLNQEGSE